MSRRSRLKHFVKEVLPAFHHGVGTTVEKYYGNKNLATNYNMPTKRMTRLRKRRNNRKRKGIVKKYIPRAITSQNKFIKCKVSDYQTLTCTSGALASTMVDCASIVDPFGGFGSGQPLGYDQWGSLYHTAFVVGTKIKVSLWNNQSTALAYGINIMSKDQGYTALTDYEHYRELPKCISRILSPDVDHGYLVNKVSTKKHLGLKDIKDNDTLRNNIADGVTPSEHFYAHIWAQPLDKTTTLTAVQAIIDVEYIILLTNPVVPARSVGA